jgi:hypothetical protein
MMVYSIDQFEMKPQVKGKIINEGINSGPSNDYLMPLFCFAYM